jgi:hypothetical protein
MVESTIVGRVKDAKEYPFEQIVWMAVKELKSPRLRSYFVVLFLHRRRRGRSKESIDYRDFQSFVEIFERVVRVPRDNGDPE